MQNLNKIFILLTTLSLNIKADNCHSHSIFIPRSLTTDSVLELGLTNYYVYHDIQHSVFTLQASYFHNETNNNKKLAKYFLPNNKTSITVFENGNGDVNSSWLGLISGPGQTFNSDFRICPKRKVNGGYFNLYFDFNRWVCGLWGNIAFAAASVEHKLNIKETANGSAGTFIIDNTTINNITSALNNPSWCFGKFFSGCKTKSGVDDIQLKLGWNRYFCSDDHFGFYLVGTIPTGKGPKSEFVFEPLIGSKHGSLGFGLNSDLTVWYCGNHNLNWMYDFKYRYVFKHCQLRSFDTCCGGNWSRYLQIVTEQERSFIQPAINFLTLKTEVTPRNTIDFWTALHYQWCYFNLELGYNLWWRQSEKVCIKEKLSNIGIYDFVGDCAGNPTSANCASINSNFVSNNLARSDSGFISLVNADLNLKSGAHPTALTSTIYGAFSFNSEIYCYPTLIGFGGSYEFAHKAALEQWAVWLKTAISF